MSRSSSSDYPSDPALQVMIYSQMAIGEQFVRNKIKIITTIHITDPSAGSPTETLLRLLLPLDTPA